MQVSVQEVCTPPPLLASSTKQRFIARQPIFSNREEVVGYELLFRAGAEDYFECDDPDRASCTTMDRTLLLGDERLTRGKPAFVNCTRELLVKQLVTVMPSDKTVLEVLEDVPPDAEVIAACEQLKRRGYRIALDDYTGDERWEPLLHLADILKVDFRLANHERREELSRRFRSRRLSLLAEKVETREEFDWARSHGYRYFQGYFFSRPTMVATHDVPSAELNHLQMLDAIHQHDLDVLKIERIIKQDPSLCYRLLRYLNSAAFGVFPIRSVKHALILLGETEVRKWISVMLAAALARSKPDELLVQSLTRAHFCEAIAPDVGLEAPEQFLTGLLSLMDVLLDCPMETILAALPVSRLAKMALLGGGFRERWLLDLSIAMERGEWQRVSELAYALNVSESDVCRAHSAAMLWAGAVRDKY